MDQEAEIKELNQQAKEKLIIAIWQAKYELEFEELRIEYSYGIFNKFIINIYYHSQMKVIFSQVCVCPGGCAWLGACMVAGGMCSGRGACMVAGGHAWWQGACVVAGGMCGGRGHVWW